VFLTRLDEKCYDPCVIQLEDTRQTISFELETLDIRPDPEPLLVEMIHVVSMGNFSHCLFKNFSSVAFVTTFTFGHS